MANLTSFLKKKPKILLYVLLGTGLFLILLSYGFQKRELAKEPSGTTKSETEEKLCRVLSEIEGAGKVEVMVTDDEAGTVGAVVVAEGGESLTVRSDLIRACCAVLKLPAENVQVFTKEEEK